ncbi:13573_t:CDS:2 [Ambispora leptoticha]|uniref:13573_t:CDS:1 n=1 Tax=Ambispora leptoticha TaxID=144679 RepID=A0A9N9AW75_9GLOM|nr:13573_t:CDS:2 [Ambispora leptoticha]
MAANSFNSSQSVSSPIIKRKTSATKTTLTFLDTRKEAIDALKKSVERLMSEKM